MDEPTKFNSHMCVMTHKFFVSEKPFSLVVKGAHISEFMCHGPSNFFHEPARQEIQLELHFKTSFGHGKSASRSPDLGYNCTSFSQTNMWNSSVIFQMKLGIPVLCATFSSFFILLYICEKRHKKAMPTSHQLAYETGRMYIL